jgi:hypothetical protein
MKLEITFCKTISVEANGIDEATEMARDTFADLLQAGEISSRDFALIVEEA